MIISFTNEKSLQALSECGKMEAVEIERNLLMKFLELNKNVMTKHFIDKPVDPKATVLAIEIKSLVPGAHNSQPLKFVVFVREMLN